jgi:hypothetical protein
MRARLLPATALTTAVALGAALGPGLTSLTVTGCAHKKAPAPEGPTRSLATEAGRIGRITYEDDFTEARLVFQALPPNASERAALRDKLLHYLLDPVLALSPTTLRREVRDLENDDVYDVVFESRSAMHSRSTIPPSSGARRRGSRSRSSASSAPPRSWWWRCSRRAEAPSR